MIYSVSSAKNVNFGVRIPNVSTITSPYTPYYETDVTITKDGSKLKLDKARVYPAPNYRMAATAGPGKSEEAVGYVLTKYISIPRSIRPIARLLKSLFR